MSSPGQTGRSSTPRPIGSSTDVSGILDHPHARVMTLSQFRELVSDVLKMKREYDLKNLAHRLPIEKA